jgi:hypothetical protein
MSAIPAVSTFFFVRLWSEAQDIQHATPTLQQRVLAPSEAHAVVQVMKHHHLKAAARAWVSRTAQGEPTLRLACIIVKGKKRSWKLDPAMWMSRADMQGVPAKEQA